MEKCSINKIHSPYFDINLAENSFSVDIKSTDHIPKEYFKIKFVETPDKTKLKEDMKRGINIIGCSLVKTLTIK
jgi:hypothetical protein